MAKRILVIDDEELIIKSLKKAFGKKRFYSLCREKWG